MGDEIDYLPEYGAHERTGPGNLMGMRGLTRFEQITTTPLERFISQVDGDSRYIRENFEEAKISDEDIEKMMEKAKSLDFIERRNAMAFVLSFIVINNQGKISVNTFNKVVDNILPSLVDTSIRNVDIIRYARMWERIY